MALMVAGGIMGSVECSGAGLEFESSGARGNDCPGHIMKANGLI